MKIRILSILLLLALLFLVGCQGKEKNPSTDTTTGTQASDVPTDTSSTPDDTGSTPDLPSPPPFQVSAENVLFSTLLWGSMEYQETMVILDTPAWESEIGDYKSGMSAKDFQFLGETYSDAEYRASYGLDLSALLLDQYVYNHSSGHRIVFRYDENAEKLFHISNVPYVSSAQTETEYLAEVATILGNDYTQNDQYRYSISTLFSPEGNLQDSVAEFQTPSEEDVVLRRRFTFTKYIDGRKTDEKYHVEFDVQNQTIQAAWYELGYTETTFEARKAMNMEEIIQQYLASHKNPKIDELGDYTLQETMFVRNGKPYSQIIIIFAPHSGFGAYELIVPHTVE